MVALAVLGLLLPFGPNAAPAQTSDAQDRIRATDASSRQLVADGRRRSPTLAALLARLEHSEVVAYISSDHTLAYRGALTFVANGGGLTYVLVRIQPALTLPERLAALGHELQHAVEVADAHEPITDDGTLAAYYRQIGTEYRKGAFESVQARAVEAQVRREVITLAAARAKIPRAQPAARRSRSGA